MSAYSIVGLVLGIVGVVGSVELAQTVIRANLPVVKQKKLEESLDDAEQVFKALIQENQTMKTEDVERIRDILEELRVLTGEYRAKVYSSRTFKDQFVLLLQGLSWKIVKLTNEVIELRVALVINREISRQSQDTATRLASTIHIGAATRSSSHVYRSERPGAIYHGVAGQQRARINENMLAVHAANIRNRRQLLAASGNIPDVNAQATMPAGSGTFVGVDGDNEHFELTYLPIDGESPSSITQDAASLV